MSTKDVIEWGLETGAGSFDVVDKSVLEGAGKGIEKTMGFQGMADPASGYYCFYNEGKLVGSGEDNLIQTSKKLQ